MAKISAGLLMYRHTPELNIFLVHPGGPYFAKRDQGWWTIPKGLVEETEDPLAAAIREFTEETGLLPTQPFHPLGSTVMKSGKKVMAWAFSGDWEENDGIRSNTFLLEWPPGSGRQARFPEADKARWFTREGALKFIHPSQQIFIEVLSGRATMR